MWIHLGSGKLKHILSEIKSGVGFITLNRHEALNALSLDMVLALSHLLNKWKADASVRAVAIRGSTKKGPFGHFCAGGDIRFFHAAATSGDTKLDEFFTAEYRLNHLIFTYPKPYIAFLDGVVMGGGMGISQGASLRIVTERTKMAMPETNIGFFPDVGGGFFLSRCPGNLGEYLGLTGQLLSGSDALYAGLADYVCESKKLDQFWETLGDSSIPVVDKRIAHLKSQAENQSPSKSQPEWWDTRIDDVFAMASIQEMTIRLKNMSEGWPAKVLSILKKRSPLMLQVTLSQLRRGRNMSLGDELRMERDLVHNCFYTVHLGRSGFTSETVEGIRALVIDKDLKPRWNPRTINEVKPEMVEPFFKSPWTKREHPLSDLV